jgi:predicted AAA+ superfamily ATPase
MFYRILDLNSLIQKSSFFLFGPRATGKSFLIRQQFSKDIPIINLLNSRVYDELRQKPYEIDFILAKYQGQKIAVIDEVQRVPMLLNEVHRLIEEDGYRFLLTGSSTRQLRGKGVNLLAGRAWEANLFPLTMAEIPDFDLDRYLCFGGLPAIYTNEYPDEALEAYVKTYLSEEIQAEAFVRKVPAFSRFLQIAALTNGQMLNFTSIANDTGLAATTIREYYQILEDTLLGFLLPAWQKTQKRKSVSTAKFYFFDTGVTHRLSNINALPKQSDLYGRAFEHFIAMELRAFLSYRRLRLPLQYWRSMHGHEVDFIIGDEVAIEVKCTDRVNDKHLKMLHVLKEEGICKRYYLISQDRLAKKKDDIEIIHWQEFIEQLYAGKILG